MPSPWNDATDRQLLLTIITLTAPQLPKWDQVANLMGEGFTAESVRYVNLIYVQVPQPLITNRQHFQKMRKDCKAQFGEKGDAGTASPSKGTPTPRERKPNANGETPGKSGAKRKGKVASTSDAEDDQESPCKKVKAESEEADGSFL